jgi:hypothetical protein
MIRSKRPTRILCQRIDPAIACLHPINPLDAYIKTFHEIFKKPLQISHRSWYDTFLTAGKGLANV